MSKAPSEKAKPKIHPGWGKLARQATAPAPHAAAAPQPVATRRGATPDYYVPADDPGLATLVEALVGSVGTAPVVTAAGNGVTAGSPWIARLRGESGWLMIANYRLQTLGIVTDHYVLSAICDDVPSLHPEAGLALARHAFEQAGMTIDVPGAVSQALRQGLQRQTPRFARERHKRNVVRANRRLDLLTQRLDELDREIAARRRALRGFLRRTDAYLAFQEELTRLLQEDRKVFVERRMLRGGHYGTGTAFDELAESMEPVGILRWHLTS